MLIFLIITFVFLSGIMCFARVAYTLIQPGQLFGKWQEVLGRMSESRNKNIRSLAKPLGDCELCFSHFIALTTYPIYVLFCNQVSGYWITNNGQGWLTICLINAIWYCMYGSASTWLNLHFILKANMK